MHAPITTLLGCEIRATEHPNKKNAENSETTIGCTGAVCTSASETLRPSLFRSAFPSDEMQRYTRLMQLLKTTSLLRSTRIVENINETNTIFNNYVFATIYSHRTEHQLQAFSS